jgi:hypothetical protein
MSLNAKMMKLPLLWCVEDDARPTDWFGVTTVPDVASVDAPSHVIHELAHIMRNRMALTINCQFDVIMKYVVVQRKIKDKRTIECANGKLNLRW